jgi:hypothetical protein
LACTFFYIIRIVVLINGVTLAFFQSLGSTPIDNDKIKIYIKDILVDEPPLLEVAGQMTLGGL